MPTLYLICGLPSSGKTTLAGQLEYERRGLRLSPDEWMWSLSIDFYDGTKRVAVEALQWEVAARALNLGVDVILEKGFSSRCERDDYRSRGEALRPSAGSIRLLLFLRFCPFASTLYLTSPVPDA